MRVSMLPAIAVVFALTSRPAGAAEQVIVANLPAVQEVSGTVGIRDAVTVRGRLDATRFVAFEDRLTPPLGTGAMPRDMVDLGIVDATGFGSVNASVAGWLPSGAKESGMLGLLLVPDVAVVRDAVDREGTPPLALRVEASLARQAGKTVLVSSGSLPLAFPKWHAYLYNTSGTSLRAHAFLMLGD